MKENLEALTWEERKAYTREAYVKRLRYYWNAKNFPRIYTHVGEIYEVDFGENVGSEFSGRHLAICLSETTIHQDRVMVVPLTTKFKQYNLKHIIDTTAFNGTRIHAGVMINEATLISKLRLFQKSLIVEEDKYGDDGVYAVGRIKLTKNQVKTFREVNV